MSVVPAGGRCLVCGGEARRRNAYRRGPWRVRVCRACGHGWTDPMPDEQTLAGFYETAAYYGARGMEAVRVRPDDRLRAGALWARLGPGRLLDVGCGTGAFLAAAREAGFQVVGTELSTVAAEVARREFGTDVRVGPFGAQQFRRGERFDVITMIHVLEHMRDPDAALATARRLLRPGGLVVIEVPNRRAVAARLPGLARRRIYDLPVHLHHFVPESLVRLLERSGFVVESVVVALPGSAVQLLGAGVWLAGLAGVRGARGRRPEKERGEGAVVATGICGQDMAMDGGRARGPGSGALAGAGIESGEGCDVALAGALVGDRVVPGWGARAVAWIRDNLPGWKFTLTARRPGRRVDRRSCAGG